MIEADARRVAERITTDFTTIRNPDHWIWRQTPAAKVIDCVLSLRKKYATVVVPRVREFVERHPTVRSCDDLLALIAEHESPAAFIADQLRMRSPDKGAAIAGVAAYLVDMQQRFDHADEEQRLQAWAQWARPGDYLAVDVHRFGLAGFQYLRMLFGASTVKPDVHILNYLTEVLGRRVTDVQAVYILERAAELAGIDAIKLDVTIWERGSGHSLPS